jgi:predicted peptidase
MRRLTSWLTVTAALAVIGGQCGAQPSLVTPAHRSRGDTGAFASAVFTASDGTRLPFRLLAPAATTRGHRYPLILQFHGSGAIGTDNAAQLGPFATGWAAPDIRARFAAYVLVPQFPARTVDYSMGSGRDDVPVSRALPPLAAALELLDSLRQALPVDTTRVYVVGFSMGGSSVWHALLGRPTAFAAAMSIAGVPPAAADLKRLPRVPLLLVHGTADSENPYAAARGAYDALPPPMRNGVELHAYPGLGHEIPADVLAGDWWREWLFVHRR